jgi:hypothetical protein
MVKLCREVLDGSKKLGLFLLAAVPKSGTACFGEHKFTAVNFALWLDEKSKV